MEKKLNILQIGALGLPVRKDLQYAGTERIVSYLDDEFVRQGHYSVVAAPGDSDVSGELFPTIPESLWKIRDGNGGRDILLGDEKYAEHYNKIIDFILANRDKLDIVHDHPGNGFVNSDEFWRRRFALSETGIPILTTHHGKFMLDFENKYDRWKMLKKEGHPIYFNAISKSQKREFEQNTRVGIDEVIYHGIPLSLFNFNASPQDYMFSIGRICPEKGQDLAIKVAKKTGRPLIIAGEVHSVNKDYFHEKVKPYLDFSIGNLAKLAGADWARNYKREFLEKLASGEEVISEGQVKYIGGLNDQEKNIVYGNAYCYLMPITWPEPFGLVMIESMATGTPVIAFNYGSVSEVIRDGETGYIVQPVLKDRNNLNEDAMVHLMSEAVDGIERISRHTTRKRLEDNFISPIEAENYLDLYSRIIDTAHISPRFIYSSLNLRDYKNLLAV